MRPESGCDYCAGYRDGEGCRFAVEFAAPRMDSKNPSSFDFVTKLLLPALALIALILGQIRGSPPGLQWALLVLIVLLVGFGFFYAPFATKIRRWREQAREIQATAGALPELRRLARNFAEFVDTGRPDTFHYIVVSELCQGNGELIAKLPIPDVSLWYHLSVYFSQRVVRLRPKMSELQATMMEFHHLVGSYNNMCVAVVFERLPKDLQPAMTPKVKSSLNGFQQRFVSFLKEYEDFVIGLAEAQPIYYGLPRSFVRPKPLT